MSLCLHQQLHASAGQPSSRSDATAELTHSGTWLAGSIGISKLLIVLSSAAGTLIDEEAQLLAEAGEWIQRTGDNTALINA